MQRLVLYLAPQEVRFLFGNETRDVVHGRRRLRRESERECERESVCERERETNLRDKKRVKGSQQSVPVSNPITASGSHLELGDWRCYRRDQQRPF